jgi:hypothetical protein
MRLTRRLLPLLYVAALGLAAAAVAAGATWPRHEANAADQALAQRSILHLSDLPSGVGWTSAPSGITGTGASFGDDPSCDGPAFSDEGRVLTGSADSSFTATGVQVWSSAEVLKTLSMAQRDARVATSAAVLRCLETGLRKSLPSAAHLVSVDTLGFPPIGDWSAAYRAIVDVNVKGGTTRLQSDMILARVSRVEISFIQLAPSSISSIAKAAEVRFLRRLAGSPLAA